MVPLWQLCEEGKLDKVREAGRNIMICSIVSITVTNSITTTTIIIIITIFNNIRWRGL